MRKFAFTTKVIFAVIGLMGGWQEPLWAYCVNRDTGRQECSPGSGTYQVLCCSGDPLKWVAGGMTYAISTGTNSAHYPRIRAGFQKWTDVVMSLFTFTDGGTTTITTRGSDGTNLIHIDPLCRTNGICGASTLGVSSYWYSGANILEADVILNGEDFTWGDGTGGTQNTTAVVAHEAGHNAGLTHPGSTCRASGSAGCGPEFEQATMYWNYSYGQPTDKTSLELDDLASLISTYPRSTFRVLVQQGGSPVSGATVELIGTSAPVDGSGIATGGQVFGDVSNAYLFGNKAASTTYVSTTPFSNTNASGYTNYVKPVHQSFSVRATKGVDTVTQAVTVANGTSTVTVNLPLIPGYCTSASSNGTGEWISRVQLHTGDTGTQSPAQSTYTDYTGTVLATLTQGGSFTISVTGNTTTAYEEFIKVWIDFNHDLDFADTGEEIDLGNYTFSGAHVFSAVLDVPATALTGSTRMRIILRYDSSPLACGTYSFGETEDYTVSISPADSYLLWTK